MTRREQTSSEVLLVDVGRVEGHPFVSARHGPLWSLHASLLKAGYLWLRGLVQHR